MGDLGSIPGLGRSPGEGKGYPLQYSGLENSMYCIVYGVTKSQTWLSDFKKKNVGLGWEFDDLSERHCSLEQAITHLNTLIFKFADSFFFFFSCSNMLTSSREIFI